MKRYADGKHPQRRKKKNRSSSFVLFVQKRKEKPADKGKVACQPVLFSLDFDRNRKKMTESKRKS